MNKPVTIIILACLFLGIALIIASKIHPTVLLTFGILAIIISILLTIYVVYQSSKNKK